MTSAARTRQISINSCSLCIIGWKLVSETEWLESLVNRSIVADPFQQTGTDFKSWTSKEKVPCKIIGVRKGPNKAVTQINNLF